MNERVLHRDHPAIAHSMALLARTCRALARHKEALKLQEEVLEFKQRVLPKDHPDIALSMLSLAWTYGELARHKEALKL